ncbi:MAG: HEAT repeat domain-containing protein [Planctomycetota bacterium]|nr:HEAT repeat domain-containing protein [Planctomycetota bacterium]
MAETKNLAEWVNSMPELDPAVADKNDPSKKNRTDEFKLTGPKWGEAQKAYDAILLGGPENIMSLIGMLSEGNDPARYKPRYALHGLALYVCRAGKEKERAMLVGTLASQLGGDRAKWSQAILVRELEWAGNKDAVAAVGKLMLDDEIGDDAVRTIVAIRDGAAEQLRAALGNAKGRRRLAIVQALGVIGDAGSVAALKAAAGDGDAEVRQAAVWGLANMGEASAVDLLIKASDAVGWERIKATKACLVAAEKLTAAGKKAEAGRIYKHLAETRTDKSERYVKEAAEKAMAPK